MSPFLRNLLWYGLTLVLVCAALALTAVRLLLPYAEEYRGRVEEWVSGYLGQPVRIERMDARLLMFSPTLELRGVRLLAADGEQPVARFEAVQLGVAPVASLVAGTPVLSQVTIIGARLAVERQADGSFHVEGLSFPGANEDSNDPEVVGRWLLQQDQLALRESTLVWRDRSRADGRVLSFERVSLELRNSGSRHRLSGYLRLPTDLGATIRVAADLTGDVLGGTATGELYLEAERVRPAGVLASLPVRGIAAADGEVSARAWGEWDGSHLVALEGEFSLERLALKGPHGAAAFDLIEGRFAWDGRGPSHVMDLADWMVVRDGRRWQPARARIEYVHDESGALGPLTVQADFLRLDDLASAAALLPLSREQRRMLTESAPTGDLHSVRLERDARGTWSGSAVFSDLSMRPRGEVPGFEGLDGQVYASGNRVGVQLASRDTVVLLPTLFRDPIPLHAADGKLEITRDGQAWRLSGRELHVTNDDISARLGLVLTVPDAGQPHLQLLGDYRNGRATAVWRYLPARLMPENAVRWLDRAFKGGRIVGGGVLFHGRLADFPFDRAQGRFQVRFDARDVVLDYAPGWPRLQGISGEVLFDGRRMVVDADAARLLRSTVSRTRVSIDDLMHARLRVQGRVEGPFADVLDYLHGTELAGHFGPTLAGFRAAGRSTLDLYFEQPLDGNGTGMSSGALSFLDSGLTVAPGVEFRDMRGTVRFRNGEYRAAAIRAKALGGKVVAQVAPAREGAGTDVRLSGSLSASVFADLLPPSPLVSRLSGNTTWEADLHLAHAEDEDSVLAVRSSLSGLTLDFPAPLDKDASERLPLELRTWFSGTHAGEVEASLGSRLSAAWRTSEGGGFDRAAVHFGPGRARLPDSRRLHVTGVLAPLDPVPWAALLAEPAASAPPTTGTGAEPLPVHVDLEELAVMENAAPAVPAGALPATGAPELPPFNLRVERFSYGGAKLGRLVVDAEPSPSQLLVKELSLEGPGFQLTGSGVWRHGGQERTQLDIKLSSRDMGAMTRTLGIASVITSGRVDAEAKLAWPDAPTHFDAARLDGSVRVKLKDGVIEDVNPGAGRLLGLLSLQALPQRLLLDFRDMFEKGMRFRTIEGDFRVENGDAITDNLRMDTLPAAVLVTGRTGLGARDYDQSVTVVPHVAGTLPVAGSLALGPQVGAALLLFQGIFKSQIDEAAKFQYRVTGTWEKPVVTQMPAR